MSFSLIVKTPDDLAAEALAALQAQIALAIDAHVEAQAKAMGYNSAANCAGYRDSTVPAWAAEAQAFIAWRDAVWQAAYDELAAYEQSQTVPGVAEVIAALPAWAA